VCFVYILAVMHLAVKSSCVPFSSKEDLVDVQFSILKSNSSELQNQAIHFTILGSLVILLMWMQYNCQIIKTIKKER
jgi:hypothetical protein